MSTAQRPVLVAPDKFKGTLSSRQVAGAVAEGLLRIGIVSDVCQIADGGEGTIETVQQAVGGELVAAPASDALGRPTAARYLRLSERRALIQTSDAIGLELIAAGERDALAASSRGAGQLLVAAAEAGATELLIGIGGTASSDGGAGALEVLREARLLGDERVKLIALCDVRAAWEQAATVFARQKGATDDEVVVLERRLGRFAAGLPKDPRRRMMTGAGGGLAGGLWAAAGAELKSGAAWVLDQVDFTPRMLAARAVITGEGSLDRQTLLGKAVGEVATRARQSGVPCHAIVGRRSISEFDARILDFENIAEAVDGREIANSAEQLAGTLPEH